MLTATVQDHEREATQMFWSEVHEWREHLKEQNYSREDLMKLYKKALEPKNIEWLTALAEEIKERDRLN